MVDGKSTVAIGALVVLAIAVSFSVILYYTIGYDVLKQLVAINEKINFPQNTTRNLQGADAKSTDLAPKTLLGIIGARSDEIDPILNSMNNRVGKIILGRTFFTGEIDGKHVVAVAAGRGKVNAAMTTHVLIQNFEPKGIIFTGIAGALTNDTKKFYVGDVVIGNKTFYHDWRRVTDTPSPYNKHFDQFLTDQMRTSCYDRTQNSFLPDKDLHSLALQVLKDKIKLKEDKNITTDFIVTGDQLISSQTESNWIHKTFFKANVTEMEGAAVAHAACTHNTPYLIIRGISDPAFDAEKSKQIRDEKRKLAAENSATVTLEIIKRWVHMGADVKSINYIVVIYMENHSFDNLYGQFPGANGLDNAGEAALQVNEDGQPYDFLPAVIDAKRDPPERDERFPDSLPNKPFLIENYVHTDEVLGSPIHKFYQEQQQINGGKMNKFALVSDVKGLVMGYYDTNKLPLAEYAKKYTLGDNFFHAAFGGSFLNHFWLICACTPKYDNPPRELINNETVTPDGYAVNTIESIFMPHNLTITDDTKLLPTKLLQAQTMPTIGDRLTGKNISWAWYSGGFNNAVAGKPDKLFQFHHQPFAYFEQFGDGTEQRRMHLKDSADFITDIQNGNLPAVSFYKPIGALNEHPGYAALIAGEQHIAYILQKIEQSPMWKDTVVFITYDENGGFWDHVAPPKGDRWGPGSRVPFIVVSPFAKKGFIDHTQYDTTSILKFIEERYGLQPLGDRDTKAANIEAAFDFAQATSEDGGTNPVPATPPTGAEVYSGFPFPLILIFQFAISGAAAGAALYFASRFLDHYRRPLLKIDKENSPMPVSIDIEVFRTEFQSIIYECRISYIVNRIIVRNLGKNAAENCKGSIMINGVDEKVCWYIPRERYTITINAKDKEYLDVCAVLSEYERDRSQWLKEIRDRASLIPDIEGYIDKIEYVPTLESFRIRRETLQTYKSVDDIPLIIAPTEEGWIAPLHHNRKIKPGTMQLKITAKNAEPIVADIRILDKPDKHGRIIEFV